ncbi:hypothetical protein TPAR_04136, partial [Tolypocladium paradoxum]
LDRCSTNSSHAFLLQPRPTDRRPHRPECPIKDIHFCPFRGIIHTHTRRSHAQVQARQGLQPHAGDQEDARAQGQALPEHPRHRPRVPALLRLQRRQHAQQLPQGRAPRAVRLPPLLRQDQAYGQGPRPEPLRGRRPGRRRPDPIPRRHRRPAAHQPARPGHPRLLRGPRQGRLCACRRHREQAVQDPARRRLCHRRRGPCRARRRSGAQHRARAQEVRRPDPHGQGQGCLGRRERRGRGIHCLQGGRRAGFEADEASEALWRLPERVSRQDCGLLEFGERRGYRSRSLRHVWRRRRLMTHGYKTKNENV